MPKYEAHINEEGQLVVYLTKKSRSHHKQGWKSVSCERIPLEKIPKDTLVKLQRKGLANLENEVLP